MHLSAWICSFDEGLRSLLVSRIFQDCSGNTLLYSGDCNEKPRLYLIFVQKPTAHKILGMDFSHIKLYKKLYYAT
jgi:hypothetical protein